MGESRTFSLPGQYLCKCIKNKQRFLHKNKVQFPQDWLHCLYCLQVAVTAPERGPIKHPAPEGWPHHQGLLPLLLSIEQWCGLFYVPREPSGSAVRRVACLASVSARVGPESLDESKKKKRNDGEGGGERRKRLPANPAILKNCVRPRTQFLIDAVLVVLIT